MHDITTALDIHHMVESFYKKVNEDELLAPFFSQLNWEEHLPNMENFWRFVLLDEAGYTTNVTEKHLHIRLSKEHFDRWLSLFNENVDRLFSGERANAAKQRAALIGLTIQSKMG